MCIEINSATGLPMIDGIDGVDVGGSPFGIDIHDHGDFSSNSFDYGWDHSMDNIGIDNFGMDNFGMNGTDNF